MAPFCSRASQGCMCWPASQTRLAPCASLRRSCPGHKGAQRRRSSQAVCAQTPAQPGLLTGLFEAIRDGLQQAGQPQVQPATLSVDRLCYHPPGAAAPLLNDVSLRLAAGGMGLVYGRSGAGKSTLLQLVAGLAQPTSGSVAILATGQPRPAEPMGPRQLASRAGLVFQFPERHFLGGTIYDELTFAWPSDPWQRQAASLQLTKVLEAVDLAGISLRTPLASLSDGYKRRVALAVQLARGPSLLLLDEPLAGLDWRARADVARVLGWPGAHQPCFGSGAKGLLHGRLKSRCTVLAVSHDLRELVPLVDSAWQMAPGGTLQPSAWPPPQA